MILIGGGGAGERVAAQATAWGVPVHRGRLAAEGPDFAGRRVMAFAGIGRPQKFFATLVDVGADLAATRSFPDHHPYRPADLHRLAADARSLGASLVTTEKDAARLPPGFAEVLPVRLVFEHPEALAAQIAGAATARR